MEVKIKEPDSKIGWEVFKTNGQIRSSLEF